MRVLAKALLSVMVAIPLGFGTIVDSGRDRLSCACVGL